MTMQPITTDLIRASLVNGTKGDAKRLVLPNRLADVDWESLDFFGWRDPGSMTNGGMALWLDGELLSIALKATVRPATAKQSMCSLCLTFHSSGDIAFMGAKRAGAKGRDDNTVAASMCSDLACSLYVRGIRRPRRVQPQETLDVDARIQRLQGNLEKFVARVMDQR